MYRTNTGLTVNLYLMLATFTLGDHSLLRANWSKKVTWQQMNLNYAMNAQYISINASKIVHW